MRKAASPRLTDPSTATKGAPNGAPVSLRRILVALDASAHADRALAEAARLAASADGVVTGIHAYAAKMHDRRFRQMEGGLPERYREEAELERQREVHDTLITRGLSVISDSYHDAARPVCEAAAVPYRALSPEGKNYRRIVEATQSGDFDVLVLGALGLGAVPGSTVGTVCERVVRRSPIDTLVIRDPGRALGDGSLVAALDGSPRSFGALRTALDLGRRLDAPVHAVAAYDPYFHYVAFHRIAAVLSDEAARTFRFKEQEKLHEDIIDSGLAKIYQSHLEIARQVAVDEAEEIECKLLDGKPYQAIARYLEDVGASLVVLGKTGIHADAGLDIGGNAENLLRMAPCHVWLGQVEYIPPLEAVAKETISWSAEAEAAMLRVPEGPRAMIRMAILRYAHERGHTVITSDLIDETTERFCPARGAAAPDAAVGWSAGAQALLGGVGDMAASIRLRAEKRARRDGAATVTPDHVRPFLGDGDDPAGEKAASACRFADLAGAGTSGAEGGAGELSRLAWTPEAEARLESIPEGFMRALTRQRIEAFARRRNVTTITPALMDEKYAEWGAGSAQQRMTLDWAATALAGIGRIPGFVRGMVILEIERCAREMGKDAVTDEVIARASTAWNRSGAFHSDANPDFYK